MNKTSTLRDIDKIVGRINTHPEYSSIIREKELQTLHDDAIANSVSLEQRGSGAKGYRGNSLSDQATIMSERLNQAYNYLLVNGLDLHSIGRLGNFVDPDKNPNKVFRRGSEIEIAGFSPPSASEVPYEIKSLVEFLDTTAIHPVLRAAEAHLEIVRIQPYSDGNKRVGRIVQNFCLEQRGYPPAIISANERTVYMPIMVRALAKRYARDSSPLVPSAEDAEFHEFISTKVLDSVEKLEKALQKRRAYVLHVRHSDDPGDIDLIARRLRVLKGEDKSRGIEVKKVRCEERGKKLQIIGDIGLERIEEAVKTVKEKEEGFVMKLGSWENSNNF